MPHAIGSSGAQLIQSADALLTRSAGRINQSLDEIPDAVLDIVDARLMAASGAKLVRVEGEIEKSVLDLIA